MFLKVTDLHYKYMRGAPLEVHALKGVTLSVAEGEFAGIIGSSGAGKTTLIQLLSGLLQPTAGQVIINGLSTADDNSSLSATRRRMGILFQHPEQQLFAETIYQDVSFGPRNMGFPKEEIDERVREALDRVGLDYNRTKDLSPFRLSGGEMRRVALAGIIAMRPEALILDEPTAGLDPRGREELLGYIDNLHQRGMTIIMVSHRLEDIARYAKKVFVLHEGELVLQGERGEVFADRSRLNKYGLDLPPVTSLMHQLRDGGRDVRTDIFTVEDACKEIELKIKGAVQGWP